MVVLKEMQGVPKLFVYNMYISGNQPHNLTLKGHGLVSANFFSPQKYTNFSYNCQQICVNSQNRSECGISSL